MTGISHVAPILGIALLSLTACDSGPAVHAATDAQAPSDAVYINRASTSGLEEATFARLAETKATNPAVRSFAASLIADLKPLNQQLAALIQSRGMTPPTDMDQRHAMAYQQLQSQNGPAFDRAYLDGQLQELTMVIQAFQAEADSGKDPPVRALAQQNVPVLFQHLRAASVIAGL